MFLFYSKVKNYLKKVFDLFKNIYSHILDFSNSTTEHHIYMMASGIAFTIITSIVPTILIILFVLGYILDSQTIINQLNIYAKDFFVVGYRQDIIDHIKEQINVIVDNRGIAGFLGIAGLLWTSSALATSIRTGVNTVFNLQNEKHFLIYKLYDICVIMIMGILIYASVLIGPIFKLIFSMNNQLNQWASLNLVSSFVSEVIIIFSSLFVFLSIFRFMPYKRLNNKTLWMSTIFSSILWEVSRIAFEFYVTSFKSFSRVYGVYAIFAASAIWIYFSALVMLFGAELSLIINKNSFLK